MFTFVSHRFFPVSPPSSIPQASLRFYLPSLSPSFLSSIKTINPKHFESIRCQREYFNGISSRLLQVIILISFRDDSSSLNYRKSNLIPYVLLTENPHLLVLSPNYFITLLFSFLSEHLNLKFISALPPLFSSSDILYSI